MKNTLKTKQTTEEWMHRFDDNFKDLGSFKLPQDQDKLTKLIINRLDIKAFISDLLEQRERGVVEKIRKWVDNNRLDLLKNNPKGWYGAEEEFRFRLYIETGFNQALDDLLDFLNKEYKLKEKGGI